MTQTNQIKFTGCLIKYSLYTNTGSPEIHPDYQPDESTSRNYAMMQGARVLNITDDEILQEYSGRRTVKAKKSLSIDVIGIVGALVSVAVTGVVLAVLVYGCLW